MFSGGDTRAFERRESNWTAALTAGMRAVRTPSFKRLSQRRFTPDSRRETHWVPYRNTESGHRSIAETDLPRRTR